MTGTTRWLLVDAAHPEPVQPAARPHRLLESTTRSPTTRIFAICRTASRLTSQTTLPREIGLTYSNGPWTLLGRAQGFQTLQDPAAASAAHPRTTECRRRSATLRDTDWNGLTFAGIGEYAYFRQPTLTTGQRALYVWPTVAMERQGAAWFVHGAHGRAHAPIRSLNDVRPTCLDAPTTPYRSRRSTRSVWSSSATGTSVGAEFRADARAACLLRLRPVPRTRASAPMFDTRSRRLQLRPAVQRQPLSRQRPRSAMRTSSRSRCRRGCSTRTRAPSGCASPLGQRFYFQNQRVVLNESPRSASTSDVLRRRRGPALRRVGDRRRCWQYNQDAKQTERLNAGIRYTPAPGRVLQRELHLSRASSSTRSAAIAVEPVRPCRRSWPINAELDAARDGGTTRSSTARRWRPWPGVEYNADCWVLRLVGQRLATTTTQTTSNSVYLQIELNGLARFGTNPLELLRRSVPGLPADQRSDGVAARSRRSVSGILRSRHVLLHFPSPIAACAAIALAAARRSPSAAPRAAARSRRRRDGLRARPRRPVARS